MPPKKKANGYCMFMQEERRRIQAETKQTPSMQDMASLCTEPWKSLSAKEKARFNTMAKQGNNEAEPQEREWHRLNNQGQAIAERNQMAKAVVNRKTQENQFLMKSLTGRDILDVPFYLINFQVLYEEEFQNDFMPLEVGLVCFTLRDGITKQMQHFVDPGGVPQGSMHLALKHSENTHRIPMGFDKAEHNFLTLWNQMERFVKKDSHNDEVPPLFCMVNERNIVESCLEFMHYRARNGEPNRFTKIYLLEDLVISLLLQSGKVSHRPSETQIRDSLLRNDWDYTCSIRCAYHDETDCSYCSLAIVKRLSFALFDMLSNVLEFELTAQHRPEEVSSNTYTVLRPAQFNESNGRGRARDGPREKDNSRSSSRSTSPPSFVAQPQPASPCHIPARVWEAPKISRSVVTLSDDESDEDADEIKSTDDEHYLAELRKPKTPAMILHEPLPSLACGRGLPISRGRGLPPMEEQLRHSNPVRPPPGFVTRPGLIAKAMLPPQGPAANNPWLQSAMMRPSLPYAAGRGRGMPRQV